MNPATEVLCIPIFIFGIFQIVHIFSRHILAQMPLKVAHHIGTPIFLSAWPQVPVLNDMNHLSSIVRGPTPIMCWVFA